MASVSTYLNFLGNTEEAFRFYASVFGTEFTAPITRMSDAPHGATLSEAERNLVMHVELPIAGGHLLMGTDMVASQGHELKLGNNMSISVHPDSRAEADQLYAALAEGGSEGTGMFEAPWNAYWGTTIDRFGIRWMFNVPN